MISSLRNKAFSEITWGKRTTTNVFDNCLRQLFFNVDKCKAKLLRGLDSGLVGFDSSVSMGCRCSARSVFTVFCFLDGTMSEREIRVSGFPWTERGVNRALSSVGGTLAATREVLRHGLETGAVAAHLAGGTHHAMYTLRA